MRSWPHLAPFNGAPYLRARAPPTASSFGPTASAMQVTDALDALQEAYRAASCVHCLLVHMEDVRESQRYFTRSELTALHAVVDSEVERRRQIAHSAIQSAPASS